MTSSPPSLATSGKPVVRGQAPSAPRVPAHIGPTRSTSTDGLQHLTGQPNRPPPSVPRWLKNYTITADLLYYDDLQSVTQTRTGIYACTHTAAYTQSNLALQRHRDRGSCYLSWVGVCWKNVFLIFSFPSASADRTSLCAAFYWSQRQQAERFVKFSSFPLSFIPPFLSLS